MKAAVCAPQKRKNPLFKVTVELEQKADEPSVANSKLIHPDQHHSEKINIAEQKDERKNQCEAVDLPDKIQISINSDKI